jgi:uncharacterized protein
MTGKRYATNLSRRDFSAAFGSSALVGLAAVAWGEEGALDEVSERFVDTNVSLFQWPLRRLPCDETPRLVEKLRQHGVTSARAGTFEGMLHKDLRGANARLADECQAQGEGILVPFGSINPTQPGWEQDLRLCVERHQMPGVRLHPNYHGYKLDDPAFAEVMSAAVERGLIVQIAVHMEDERMMQPLLRVAAVDVAPLVELLPRWPKANVVLLNAMNVVSFDLASRLLTIEGASVYVETATLEGVGGLERLFAAVPRQRILFGSHAPYFYFESAALKLRESALSAPQLAAARYKNSEQLYFGDRS